jgi:hypothetical protein
MAFLFGRHRSQSDAASAREEPGMLRRSLSHQDACSEGGLRNLFRKSSDDLKLEAHVRRRTFPPGHVTDGEQGE